MSCRICLEDGGQTFCKCSGTTALVHEKCLLKWIQVSKNKDCEICHTPFIFHTKRIFKPSCFKTFSPGVDTNANIMIIIPSFMVVMVSTTCEVILQDFIAGIFSRNVALLFILIITFEESKSACAGFIVSLFSLLCLALQRNDSTDFHIAFVIQASITAFFTFLWLIHCVCFYNFETILVLKGYSGHASNEA